MINNYKRNYYSKHTYGYNTRLIAFILVFTIILSSVFTGGFSASAETVDNGVTSENTETVVPEEPYVIGEDTERRGENEKHFLMSDGTRVATMYDTAVHYLDESGEYQEIDNSFESSGEEYQTKKGKNKVKLAKKASAKKLVTLHTDDYKISWGFEGAEKVKAQVIEDNNETDEDFAVKNVNGKMKYVDAFENVDLEYIVKPDGIKENIILKSADAQNEFVVNYDVGKLVAVQKDSRTIELLEGEAVKYTISAPVMIDADNNMSTDLSITLTEQNNGKLTVILLADLAWLSATDRTYPVTVDPSISSTLNFSSLKCKFTYSETGAEVSNLANSVTDMTFVGTHPYFGATTSLYYFEVLPTLTKGDYLTGATFCLAGSENPGFQINAYECAEIWFDSSTEPLNYEPLHQEEVLDYVGYESDEYFWNITNQVRRWYNLGTHHSDNCGIILKSDISPEDCIAFGNSSNSDTNLRPVLVISYVNHSGIENYLSYTSLNAGGGTAYINNASGVMTLELPILSTRGENLPASLVMYHNATESGIQSHNKIGAGWRTNYDQKITAVTNSALLSNGYKYTYTDGDGTVHYLKTVEGKTNEYADEVGAGLTLKYSNNAFTLSDKENNICYFNNSGYLTKQKSGTSPSVITLTYGSSNKLNAITDGAGDTISFERNANGVVTAIVDNYNRKINLSYTNSNLSSITYFDGTVLSFNYNSEGFLTLAVDETGMKTTFEYNGTACPAWNGRVSFVYEKSKNDSTSGIETGNFLDFRYTDSGYTEIVDNNINKTYYIFDEFGRSINGFSDNGSVSAEYTAKDENANYKNNKIERTTSTGTPIENLAINTSYESEDNWFPYVSETGTASATLVTEQRRLGAKSLKLTASNRGSTTYFQKYTPKKSGYYTYSVYYKTDGLDAAAGVRAFIAYVDNNGNKNYEFSECKTASTNGKWNRLSVTYYCDISQIKELHISNGLFYSYSGCVYFDCAQFEYSESANEYNMISNGCFNPDENGWDISNTDSFDKVENVNSQYDGIDNIPTSISKTYTLYGGALFDKKIGQTIPINLPTNKIALNFSAYAIAMACKENGFAMELTFNYSDGTKETETRNFNYKCYAWQYLTELFVPNEKNKIVSTVDAYLIYNGQENAAQFTGVQLLVDTSGMMYTYDDKGNAISALDTGDNAVSSVYDTENRLTSKTLQDGSVFTYDYLANSAVSTRLVQSQTAPHNQKTDFTYNAHGQQTSSTLYNSNETNGLKITSSASYSNNGKYLNTETDSLGNTIRYIYSTENGGYDLLDRIYSNSNSNAFTEYEYDTADRITKLTENDGNQSSASVEYVYDDNTLSKIKHNGYDYNFEYDDFGNTTKISIGYNNLITNTFSRNYITTDGITLTSPHLLTKSTYGNGDYVEYDYDKYERVIAKKFNGIVKYKYIYNSAGNIYKLIDVEYNITYTYYYDNLGRAERIYGSNNFEVAYTYDGSNRVTDEYYIYKGNTESVHHNYDVGGVLTSSTFSNGSVRSYTYDSLMRASSVSTKTSENTTESWVTSYGFLNPTEDTTTTLVNSITYNTIGLNFSYSYDNLGNITEIKENNVLKASYEYDYLNQLTRENNAYLNKTITYSYDNAGNILSKTYYNYTLGSLDGLTGTVVQYTYGDSNWKDKLTAYNGNAITYDEIGNPINYYNGSVFTWEKGRTLSSVIMSNGTTVNYRYNESGIRTYKKADGIETYYYLNGSQISTMLYGASLYRFSYDSSGQLYSINFKGEMYYYFFNVQGNVIGLYDSDLNVVVRYTYDSWGKLLSTTGSLASTLGQRNPFRYRGYYYDTESGLYYLNSRYYDPETGRFINADSMLKTPNAGVLSANMFAYCENNPIMSSDSTGQWFGLDDLIAGAVGAVVGIASQFVSDVVTSFNSGSWQISNWQTYVGAGTGGAIGGITTLYAGPVAGTAVGAGSSTLIGQTLENYTGGQRRSAVEIAKNSVVDATIGAVINKVFPMKISGLTSGRNSMSAVYSSGLKKLGNKTASKMSSKVIGKGIASGFVGDLNVSCGMGVKTYISNSMQSNREQKVPSIGHIYWCAP